MLSSNGAYSLKANMNSTDRGLRTLSFFDKVSEPTIEGLSKHCRLIELQEEASLVSPGDRLERVFFVINGELRLLVYTETGKVVSLRTATRGAFVGSAALVKNAVSAVSIEASRPTVVAAIGSEVFSRFVENDRELLASLLASIVDREKLLMEQVVELTTLSVSERIQSELLRICRKRTGDDSSAAIHPIPTHSDLARRIGTHREAVSRAMSHLQHVGVVVRDGERLFIPDIAKLAARTAVF